MSIYKNSLSLYRQGRVLIKRFARIEPTIEIGHVTRIEYHGHENYGGWGIPVGMLAKNSCIVDVGLGEDISFSESLIRKYNCQVHGFDPTPKSLSYVKSRNLKNFQLHPVGVAGSNRMASFFLPNNPNHVSGSITQSTHVGENKIEVQLIDISSVFKQVDREIIDLLKIDIEGAEYELLSSASFLEKATKIRILCIEFHHRWQEFGKQSTQSAVSTLNSLGFKCVWQARESNEEFTFINTKQPA